MIQISAAAASSAFRSPHFLRIQKEPPVCTGKLGCEKAITYREETRTSEAKKLEAGQALANSRESEILTAELATFDEMERQLDDSRMRERE